MAILATIVSIHAFAEGPRDDPSSKWPGVPSSRHIAESHQEGDLSPNGQPAQSSPTESTLKIVQGKGQKRLLIIDNHLTPNRPKTESGRLSEIQIISLGQTNAPNGPVEEQPPQRNPPAQVINQQLAHNPQQLQKIPFDQPASSAPLQSFARDLEENVRQNRQTVTGHLASQAFPEETTLNHSIVNSNSVTSSESRSLPQNRRKGPWPVNSDISRSPGANATPISTGPETGSKSESPGRIAPGNASPAMDPPIPRVFPANNSQSKPGSAILARSLPEQTAARVVKANETSRAEIPPIATPPVVSSPVRTSVPPPVENPRVETLPVEPWLVQPTLPISEQVETPESSFNTLPFPMGSASKRQLTLAETVRLGLENNKDVVVLSFDPSIEATTVDTAKSLYDPVSGATAWGGHSDVQVRSLIQTFGAPADFLDTDFLQPFQQPNNIYTKRRLYSGGEVELGFSTDYENFFPVGPQLIVNPGWDSAINFRYDQPLFAGRGEEFTTAPIRIAQANQNQARSEFMAEIRTLTRDIELAYWELAGADLALEAYESFLARGKEIFENQLKREKLGTSALPDVLQAKNLLEEFEIEVADQRQRRDVAEDNLRQIMGLPAQGDRSWFASNGEYSLLSLPLAAVEDTSAYDMELPWEEYVRMAEQRPEILAQQSAIRAARISVSLAQNQLLPDVSARANYSINGLEENLGDSLATIGRHEFKTWSVGLIYERPFGMRAQHAALRRAKLTLVQESTELDKIRHDILHALRRSEDITRSANAIYELRKKRVETAKAQMEAFDALYLEGRASLFIRLNSEQNLADARAELAQAWTRRQLAVVQRNYEANIVSPTYQVDFPSSTESAK